jgi:hypothetical protein
MTTVKIINIRHSFFLPKIINLELLDDKQLFDDFIYTPVPKTEYHQLKNDIEEYKKQIYNLNKKNCKLKRKNFKFTRKIKKPDECDECEKDDGIIKINSVMELLNLLYKLEHPDSMTE